MIPRQTIGPDTQFERSGSELYRDTRSGFTRLRDFLKTGASGIVLGMVAVAVAVEPGTVDALLPLSALYAAWVLTRRVVLPFRLPQTARRLDFNHPNPKNRRPRMSEGILYIGTQFATGQQLWLGNDDGRQHVAIPGTTGAGKTKALLSLCVNALAWGSGFIFVDGKADNRLYADVLALARKYGREDDVLALNFLVASGKKDSATFNPFAWGNADVIRELLVSQVEANPNGGSGGNNHVFMQRAVALLGALTPALVWMRDTHGVMIDIESIRFATDLQSIASLALHRLFRRRDVTTGKVTEILVDDIPEALLYPLDAYLGETGGYDKALAYNKQKSNQPAEQHSFVVMHFSATFTQLAVSLGHIFKCEIGDIDMRDVVLNRRILVVNLPTLENSGETTAALGRLVVASLRNMMAQTLGADLEGDYAEIVENKPHLAPTPFPVVFDEVGYYVVPGMDKMLAMGRGLGFMFLLGFQEVAGLRARIGETMYSLLGNANLQILMRLQEGSETRKYVEQTAGDTHVTQASGFRQTDGGGFREASHADIRQTARVNWSDLRSLIEGEAIVVMGKERHYAKLFYADVDANGPLRMNRPLMLRPPPPGEVRDLADRAVSIGKHLAAGRATFKLHPEPSPTLDALIHQFMARATSPEAGSLHACAQGAILALHHVTRDDVPARPALRHAPGKPNPDVMETEYSQVLEGSGRPASDDPPAAVPARTVAPEPARVLTEIEGSAGASPAEARARMNEMAAIRDAAAEDVPPPLGLISPVELRGHLDALIAELDSVISRPSQTMQAAE